MTKFRRPSADYFRALPQGDAFAKNPAAASEPPLGQRAAKRLLPAWADGVDVRDDGKPTRPELPQGVNWRHLVDADNTAERVSPAGHKKLRKRSWLQHLLSERVAGHADSPLKILKESQHGRGNQVWLPEGTWDVLSPRARGELQKLRAAGRGVAQHYQGAADPVYTRSQLSGVTAHDTPLPGTSLAVLGLRTSFGRQQVSTVDIEQDQLHANRDELRHGPGQIHPKDGPFSAQAARQMQPGERFHMRAERTVFAEAGLKYTATPIPGPLPFSLAVGSIMDLGPSVAVNCQASIEAETTMEVVRGFGSSVAVAVKARDERANPGQDRSFRASLGAFFDGSIPEYFAQAFRRVGGKAIEEEAETLEEQKRHMDLQLMPHIEKLNRAADTHVARRSRASDSEVTLYEVVFDLANPQARQVYDRLLGAADDSERVMDFTALQGLPEQSGVEVVANNVRTASRRGIERTFAAFGLQAHKARVTETSETRSGDDGQQLAREQAHAVVRRTKVPGHQRESVSVGRVKTVESGTGEDPKTGVGFGWRLHIKDAHTDRDGLGELVQLARLVPTPDTGARKLQALHARAETLPRQKVLGVPVGQRQAGKTEATFALELNAHATHRLLEHLDGGAKEQALWDALARAYAERQGRKTPPQWPLDDAGAWRRVKHHVDGERPAYRVAANAVEALRAAKNADGPVACAKQLGEVFDLLRGDLHFAAAVVNVAAGDASPAGIDVSVDFAGGDPGFEPAPSRVEAATLGRAPITSV